jgi:hypothetical protein
LIAAESFEEFLPQGPNPSVTGLTQRLNLGKFVRQAGLVDLAAGAILMLEGDDAQAQDNDGQGHRDYCAAYSGSAHGQLSDRSSA